MSIAHFVRIEDGINTASRCGHDAAYGDFLVFLPYTPHRHGINTASLPHRCLTKAASAIIASHVPKKRLPPTNNPPSWQSHLNPFYEDICRWRRADKSYRDIAALLQAEKGVEAHFTSVLRFVNARRRRNKARNALLADLAVPVLPSTLAPERPPGGAAGPAAGTSKGSSDSVKPFVSMTPQSTGRGLPLTRNEEVIGTDSFGRNITANRPFKGKI